MEVTPVWGKPVFTVTSMACQCVGRYGQQRTLSEPTIRDILGAFIPHAIEIADGQNDGESSAILTKRLVLTRIKNGPHYNTQEFSNSTEIPIFWEIPQQNWDVE